MTQHVGLLIAHLMTVEFLPIKFESASTCLSLFHVDVSARQQTLYNDTNYIYTDRT